MGKPGADDVELRIPVTDMVCSACEAAVERAALSVNGCLEARASLAEASVVVRCSEPCTPDRLVAAIGSAGYTALLPGEDGAESPVGAVGGEGGGPGRGDAAGGPAAVRKRALAAAGSVGTGKPPRTGAGTRPPLATALILVAVGAAFLAIELSGAGSFLQSNGTVQAEAGYAALFVVGLLTSVHCVAMCGGINLSQSLMGVGEGPVFADRGDARAATAEKRGLRAHLPGWWDASRNSVLYNLGRVVGYTLVGALLGLVGDAVSPTLRVRATIGLVTGLVMLVAGLNMLGGFGLVRRLFARMPRGLASPLRKIAGRGPFFVGLANSLMPCGPLQAIQLYALATASALVGALSMLAFCLGTVPLVLATGVVARTASLAWRRGMQAAGSALMLLLALIMVQGNLSILGVPLPLPTGAQTVSEDGLAVAYERGGVQYVMTDLDYNSFGDIEVVAGVPVEWTIAVDPDRLINCNNEIVIAAFDVEQPLHEGDNVVSFTPEYDGSFPVTCWMGMLDNVVRVVPR